MAAVSGSYRHFCFFRADTGSRRAADGFCGRLVTVLLEDLGGTTEGAREGWGAWEGWGEWRGSTERATVQGLGRTSGRVTEGGQKVSRVEVVQEGECNVLWTPRYKKCLVDSIYLGMSDMAWGWTRSENLQPFYKSKHGRRGNHKFTTWASTSSWVFLIESVQRTFPASEIARKEWLWLWSWRKVLEKGDLKGDFEEGLSSGLVV